MYYVNAVGETVEAAIANGLNILDITEEDSITLILKRTKYYVKVRVMSKKGMNFRDTPGVKKLAEECYDNYRYSGEKSYLLEAAQYGHIKAIKQLEEKDLEKLWAKSEDTFEVEKLKVERFYIAMEKENVPSKIDLEGALYIYQDLARYGYNGAAEKVEKLKEELKTNNPSLLKEEIILKKVEQLDPKKLTPAEQIAAKRMLLQGYEKLANKKPEYKAKVESLQKDLSKIAEDNIKFADSNHNLETKETLINAALKLGILKKEIQEPVI